MGIIILILIILVGGVIFYTINIYNRFQVLNNGAEASLGQIKVALKKRVDVISQLVDSVSAYAKFERSLFEEVTKLRSKTMADMSVRDIDDIERKAKDIFGNLIVTVENYPELKTSEVVKDLTKSIEDLETEIARHRYVYNNIVQEFNTKIDTVPSNFVASLFGFRKKDYLEFEEGIEEKPKISWSG